jgi:hypothetical protein
MKRKQRRNVKRELAGRELTKASGGAHRPNMQVGDIKLDEMGTHIGPKPGGVHVHDDGNIWAGGIRGYPDGSWDL